MRLAAAGSVVAITIFTIPGVALVALGLWQPSIVMWLGVLLMLYLWWNTRRKARSGPAPQYFWLYEGGMQVRSGESVRAFRWEQVTEIHHMAVAYKSGNTTVREKHSLRLALDDGSAEILQEDVADAGALVTAVKERVTRARFPAAVQALESGTPVPFGPFTVGPEGIDHGDGRLPWPELRKVEVDKGQLSLLTRGRRPWAKTAVGLVPNADLFIALVRYRLRRPS